MSHGCPGLGVADTGRGNRMKITDDQSVIKMWFYQKRHSACLASFI